VLAELNVQPKRTTTMTGFKLALAIAATFAAMSFVSEPAAAAIEYPWCVQYGGAPNGGARNCGFVSYDQCMMTARGAGGMCVVNLFYPGAAEPPLRARKRHSGT
jgi:hypothetical protein